MSQEIRVRACMALVKDGRILLVPHHQTDAGTVQWNLPGGRIHFGESLHEAVVREFQEETGLQTKVTRLLDVSEVIVQEKPWHSITVAFLGEVAGGTLNAEANHRYGEKTPRWVSPQELRDVAYHPKALIDKALKVATNTGETPQ